jgi:dUTP pyrophosphatase
MEIKMKKLTETAITPSRGSKYAAGYDLYADIKEAMTIEPHTVGKVPTGLSFQLPEGYFAGIFARSGLAAKEDLAPANMVGVCDSDYTGEYIVMLRNYGNKPRVVEPGERIAQMIVMPFLSVEFNEVAELDKTERGAGGFGSTGKN